MGTKFPPKMEPLPSDHEFYADLADLIEEHESEELDREKLLYAVKEFSSKWLSSFYLTGRTW